jgi:molybdopterin converting factor subunit 1
MKLTVKLFAAARELAGSGETQIELPIGATVGELRSALIVATPSLAALAERSMVAVNEEYASDATLLRESDVVALIPPVSGG